MVSAPVSGIRDRGDSFGRRSSSYETVDISMYMKENIKVVCINDTEIPLNHLMFTLDKLDDNNNSLYVYVLVLTVIIIAGMIIALSI
jgi:hypothetical protein